MKNIVLDDALRSKIGDLKEEAQLCDESGQAVGFLMPMSAYYRLVESTLPPISEEEMERRFAEPGAKTLNEIKRQLDIG
jgi:hypothetical protein